ncbi:hypothetical protein ZWY2020_046834 [Hordeum vulgare]|nr:hypothetical protein ZWY2020_046834 [Hordeum vulgare]
MCGYNGDFNHPQCFYNVRLEEADIVEIIKKLSGEPVENCSKIGLKPFFILNPAPERTSAFWTRGPRTVVKKTTKPSPKKNKNKGKVSAKESSIVGESRAADEQSEDDDLERQDEDVEVSPPSSGDSASSTLPPLIHLQGAQAKKRKTGESSSPPKTAEVFGMSTSIREAQEEPVETYDDIFDDFPGIPVNLPSPQKKVTENVKPPSPHKAPEDPNSVVITSTGYSKPTAAMLTKHATKDDQVFAEKDITKLNLPNYEKLEFEELYTGFVSHLETSHEMEKSLANMMRIKHKESLTRVDSTVADLKQSLAE